jgi:hypothetical protein
VIRAKSALTPKSGGVALAVLLALALAGIGLARAGSAPAAARTAARPHGVTPTRPLPPATSWIITVGTLENLLAHDTSGIVQQTFDTPTTYVLVTGGHGVPAGWTSVPTQNFKSYQTMNIVLNGGVAPDGTKLIPGIRAVLYDDEKWKYTPDDEKAHPAHYIQLAGQLAHSTFVDGVRLQFVSTPAMDLFGSVSAYLDSGIAKVAAKAADVYDIQSQSQQGDVQTYENFVTRAVTQARQAGGTATLLAGVTTTNSAAHGPYIPQDMDDAMHSVFPFEATGFWMNDPDANFCPGCTGPYPDVAIAALQNF